MLWVDRVSYLYKYLSCLKLTFVNLENEKRPLSYKDEALDTILKCCSLMNKENQIQIIETNFWQIQISWNLNPLKFKVTIEYADITFLTERYTKML